ncbi:MAG: hypothetical protein HN350_03480 [Phycisphaerales bacterium]|jgi:hypothetical protein|nr:hypothetical protein [Phycisphaerales bacterium]
MMLNKDYKEMLQFLADEKAKFLLVVVVIRVIRSISAVAVAVAVAVSTSVISVPSVVEKSCCRWPLPLSVRLRLPFFISHTFLITRVEFAVTFGVYRLALAPMIMRSF